jgi:phosphoribosyl-ATP pyrophosphohydrolase
MERREDLLGIAEKLPKSAVKISKLTASALARRIVAPEGTSLRKRR